MGLIDHLAMGFQAALSVQNLFYCFVGVMLGTAIGVLPGIGATATIALLLPITFSLDPISAIIMLAGIYYGSQYGGSTTAILVRIPGEGSSVVTAIDGYQMAQRGAAGVALATAALGSFFAGSVATFLIAIIAVPLASVALKFGSPEYFSLIVLGLVASTALAHGSVLKALAMIVVGIMLSMAGTDIYTGSRRFTFGADELADGISFVVLSIGIFGLGEIIRNLEEGTERQTVSTRITGLYPSRRDLRRMSLPVLRGTAIGSFLGILPGAGATLSSFAAYVVEKRAGPTDPPVGEGAIEAVAGPEAANNAAAQTAFIPMLTLGLPGNPVMALMIGALVIHGIRPGPGVIANNPDLFWGLVASMWIGNLMLVILNLPLIGIWVRLLLIPYRFLFTGILAFSIVGVYAVGLNAIEVLLIALFGAVGFLLVKLDFEPAPLLMGFVLGPLLEEHLRRALIISHGDLSVFIDRPISAVLLALAGLVLALTVVPSLYRLREEAFHDSEGI